MAATNHPFTLSGLGSLKNSSGHVPRFNMKNDGTYNVATSISLVAGAFLIQGYSSSLGDGGRATIDGSTNAIHIITLAANNSIADIIVQNNGSSGSNRGFFSNGGAATFIRCVANNIRGSGFLLTTQDIAVECEAYTCNTSNTNGDAGFRSQSSQTMLIKCIAHDNSGSNNDGFTSTAGVTATIHLNCIAESNGRHGFGLGMASQYVMSNCDAYNNGGDGFKNTGTTEITGSVIQNCNFIKNTGWGINSSLTTGRWIGIVANCGFGAGTQVNGSGTTNGTDALIIIGSVTYANNVTPWVDPTNGDFRINLAAAAGAGRGTFTQTQSSYGNASMLGYPDIGAVQHKDFQRSSVSSG